MRHLMEGLFERLARRTLELCPGDPVVEVAAKRFLPPFPTVDFVDALEEKSGLTDLLGKSREELRELVRVTKSTVPDNSSTGTFLDKLFEHYVEPMFDRVTFVVDYPAATTPLAKRHRSKPGGSSGSRCSIQGSSSRTRTPSSTTRTSRRPGSRP